MAIAERCNDESSFRWALKRRLGSWLITRTRQGAETQSVFLRKTRGRSKVHQLDVSFNEREMFLDHRIPSK